MTHPLSSDESSIFSSEISNFATSRNTDIDWNLIEMSNSFNFSSVFSNCFNKHGYNFDDVSKNNYSRTS